MHTDKMEVDVNTGISITNSFVLPDKFEPATILKLLIFCGCSRQWPFSQKNASPTELHVLLHVSFCSLSSGERVSSPKV